MPEFLYIHIPFCIKKCLYCDFFSVPYDESLAKTYTDALCSELSLKKGFAKTLKTIYIGGGTPSLLPDECFTQLFRCLRDNFHLSSSPEITVEANPGTINQSKITTLLSLGVNRLSIGIQSFEDEELKTLGRIHTEDDALQSIELIKNTGLDIFSIDLMYGIPGQTIDSWKKSISKAIELSPAHISTYELTLEENTPLYELIQSDEINPPSPTLNSPLAKEGYRGVINTETEGFSGKIKMPDEGLILEMYNYVIDYLTFCGYEHYEVSNFALPGFRCIHNLNYWARGEYIGVGAGAHSFVKGVRSNNIKDVNNYIDDLNKGIIPETESTKLTSEEIFKEFIFLGLRKTDGISINKLPPFTPPLARGDRGGCDSLLNACKELVDDGYLEIENGNLRLTRKGLVISNTIIVKLFERLM
ncbi:MAG: radical SAM family heme chaperone HemW [Nitrospirota bacterium]|nr:radical SAM family heme chaperone HemW [Nitrospirota bacterium]MDH5769383.1 radical SAM family heme chaperone HemW [Nitrospirota bacterium]